MDYKTAWLELIYTRDQLYLLVFVAALVGLFWYRLAHRWLRRLIVAGGGLLVTAALAWAVLHF